MRTAISRRTFALAAVLLLVALVRVTLLHAADPLDGYADEAAFSAQLKALDELPGVTVTSLGKTLGGREVSLITLSGGEAKSADKPAILIMGSVYAPHLVGSELSWRMAKLLAEKGTTEAAVKHLLETYTVYVVPRPNPDASQACFARPLMERAENQRSTDDDRDGAFDEDPPDDLNGDGLITTMRVQDEAGPYMPHPAEPRILIKADPKKNERGQFRLLSEGRDNDGDEQFNEDPAGGVSFDRNFPFKYAFFGGGAGPHPVSEVETRGVADFAFAHPNIALVFTFTPEDNLMTTWKPGGADKRIKTSLLPDDAPFYDFLAEQYRTIHGGKDAPAPPEGAGAFSEWAYFQFGRWSLAARGWWVPKVAPPEKKEDTKSSNETRGTDEVNALRWLAQEKIDGFVPWTPVEHPDFPGRKVEVGGFRPLILLNPPAKELDPLAEKHFAFLTKVVEKLPEVRIAKTKVEALGSGTFRVSATVINAGYLPTMSEMGKVTREPYPLQLRIELPKGAKLLTGVPRTRIDKLAGNGGEIEKTWLLSTGEEKGELRS